MRHLYIVVLLINCCWKINAQSLLANGSFEDENTCTEYKMLCSPEAWACSDLSYNFYFSDSHWAHSGRHFGGLTYADGQKRKIPSFIISRLLCSLRNGRQYKLTFYVRSPHGVLDSIGIHFSSTYPAFNNKSNKKINPGSIVSMTAGNDSTNTEIWQKKEIIYTAKGDEIFISMGSFKNTPHIFKTSPDEKGLYLFYIDDISLTSMDAKEIPCKNLNSMTTVLYNEDERHQLLDRMRLDDHQKPVQAPAPTIIKKIDTLIIPDILFASGSATLTNESFGILDSFCNHIRSLASITDSLVIEGHTDSVGTLLYNKKLSEGRAYAVATYIKRIGKIGSLKLIVDYYAYLRPVASNKTAEGRQRNRRVAAYLYMHE